MMKIRVWARYLRQEGKVSAFLSDIGSLAQVYLSLTKFLAPCQNI
jgi:hypothetical protein